MYISDRASKYFKQTNHALKLYVHSCCLTMMICFCEAKQATFLLLEKLGKNSKSKSVPFLLAYQKWRLCCLSGDQKYLKRLNPEEGVSDRV